MAALLLRRPLRLAGRRGSRPAQRRRNGGPLGKTERCRLMGLATAFPIILPVVTTQLINGSLITTALRLRAAHRELTAQRQPEQPAAVATTLTGALAS